MLKQFHQCWGSKVTGIQHMRMNCQIFVSMDMLVKFGKFFNVKYPVTFSRVLMLTES